MVLTIYDDMETKKLLENIKKKEPNFNLSEFVRNSLKNYGGEDDVEAITREIDKAKLRKQEAEQDLEYLREKKAKMELNVIRESVIREELEDYSDAEVDFIRGSIKRKENAFREGISFSDIAEVKIFRDKFDKPSEVFFHIRKKLEEAKG